MPLPKPVFDSENTRANPKRGRDDSRTLLPSPAKSPKISASSPDSHKNQPLALSASYPFGEFCSRYVESFELLERINQQVTSQIGTIVQINSELTRAIKQLTVDTAINKAIIKPLLLSFFSSFNDLVVGTFTDYSDLAQNLLQAVCLELVPQLKEQHVDTLKLFNMLRENLTETQQKIERINKALINFTMYYYLLVEKNFNTTDKSDLRDLIWTHAFIKKWNEEASRGNTNETFHRLANLYESILKMEGAVEAILASPWTQRPAESCRKHTSGPFLKLMKLLNEIRVNCTNEVDIYLQIKILDILKLYYQESISFTEAIPSLSTHSLSPRVSLQACFEDAIKSLYGYDEETRTFARETLLVHDEGDSCRLDIHASDALLEAYYKVFTSHHYMHLGNVFAAVEDMLRNKDTGELGCKDFWDKARFALVDECIQETFGHLNNNRPEGAKYLGRLIHLLDGAAKALDRYLEAGNNINWHLIRERGLGFKGCIASMILTIYGYDPVEKRLTRTSFHESNLEKQAIGGFFVNEFYYPYDALLDSLYDFSIAAQREFFQRGITELEEVAALRDAPSWRIDEYLIKKRDKATSPEERAIYEEQLECSHEQKVSFINQEIATNKDLLSEVQVFTDLLPFTSASDEVSFKNLGITLTSRRFALEAPHDHDDEIKDGSRVEKTPSFSV